MKRTITPKIEADDDVKPAWKKITLGSLYPVKDRTVRVKTGEIIQLTVEEIGNKMEHFELVHPGTGKYKIGQTPTGVVDPPLVPPSVVTPKKVYTLEEIEDGWFNVKHADGTVINTEKLTKTDADALKEVMEVEDGL